MKPLLFLLLLSWSALSSAQTAFDSLGSVDTEHFKLLSDQEEFVIEFNLAHHHQRIPIPREWLIPSEELPNDEGGYVSSFSYDKDITAFKIDRGLLGLHISSYSIQKQGSAGAAAGRDVFLVYNCLEDVLTPGLIHLGITKARYRTMGKAYALYCKLLISDINQDGKKDIGIIRKELVCQGLHGQDMDAHASKDNSIQHFPIRWHVFQEDPWVCDMNFDGKLIQSRFRELPLIGLVKNPVDFVKEMCFRQNILVMDYSDFGTQSMAYECIGYEWYQWNSHGDPDPKARYHIKVIVYRDINPEFVRELYPVQSDFKKDYRYVEYRKALRYLDAKISEIVEAQEKPEQESDEMYDRLKARLENTRKKILEQLGR